MNTTLKAVGLSAITSLIVSSIVVATALPSDIGDSTKNTGNQATTDMQQFDNAIVSTVKQAEPAVASVIISKDLPVMEQYFDSVPFGNGFNVRIPRQRQSGTELREVGGGTAFFIREDGLMLTNKHVVDDADATYTVLLNDGRILNATVVAQDSFTDIALLDVEGNNFPSLSLSDSEPKLGQSVIAIGNALAEFRNTVSVGVISGLQRTITAGDPFAGVREQLESIIQTDAAINSGNSGGPLIDLSGNVVGMSTAVASVGQNIGFALPASELRRVIESYEEFGRIVRPYIGVRYIELNEAIAQEQGLDVTSGALVGGTDNASGVLAGSPADKAGIEEGDVIIAIDGEQLGSNASLAGIIRQKQVGQTVQLTVLRDGNTIRLEAVLAEYPEAF